MPCNFLLYTKVLLLSQWWFLELTNSILLFLCYFISLIAFSFLYSFCWLLIFYFDIVHRKHSPSFHCFPSFFLLFASASINRKDNGKLASKVLYWRFFLSVSIFFLDQNFSCFVLLSNNQRLTKTSTLIKKTKTHYYQWFLLFGNVKSTQHDKNQRIFHFDVLNIILNIKSWSYHLHRNQLIILKLLMNHRESLQKKSKYYWPSTRVFMR